MRLRSSDAVVVCMSQRSINKEAFVQKEIRRAIDISEETILRRCQVLERASTHRKRKSLSRSSSSPAIYLDVEVFRFRAGRRFRALACTTRFRAERARLGRFETESFRTAD